MPVFCGLFAKLPECANQAIDLGARTRDLGADDDRALGTAAMTERVVDLLPYPAHR